MSRRRLGWTGMVLVVVMAGAITGTLMALPLGGPVAAVAAHPLQVVDGTARGVIQPKVVSEVKPQYTPEAMQAKIEGRALMSAVVHTDGVPREIEITKSLDAKYGLDKQAVTALSQWRFEPGRKDGKPVAVRVAVEMSFTLKK